MVKQKLVVASSGLSVNLLSRMFGLKLARAFIICYLFQYPNYASASPLIAELSDRNIVVHTAFDGAQLMLFGSRNESGDVIAVVRGPNTKATIRKKQKIFGIWVNRQAEDFENIPIFYTIAASRNFDEINKSIYLDALKIGYSETLEPFRLKKYQLIGESERAKREEFSKAMLRELRLAKLYSKNVLPINFIGDGLFRANISFPDNTPTGVYSVEVYLIDDGQIQAVHTSSINVYKSGLDSLIYQLAQKYSALYGLLAISIAVLGGLFAVKIFSKD